MRTLLHAKTRPSASPGYPASESLNATASMDERYSKNGMVDPKSEM
jgi:hypothetical protein